MITIYTHHVDTALLLSDTQMPVLGVVTSVRHRALNGERVDTRVAEGDDALEEIDAFFNEQIGKMFTPIDASIGQR